MKWIGQLFKISMSLILFSQTTWAQSGFNIPTTGDEVFKSRLSEYFYNRSKSDVLIPVRLIGGIAKPGLYHIPPGTSLTTLVSISGGFTRESDVSNISIKKINGELSEQDFQKIMASGQDYNFKGQETIFIPQKQYTFDQPTVNAFSVITGLISIVLTTVLVSDQLNK